MANHPQALKRNRQNQKRAMRNRHIRTMTRGSIKRVRAAIEAQDVAKAQEELKVATKQIDKSVTKGVLKRTTASRTISRLTIAVNKLSAQK